MKSDLEKDSQTDPQINWLALNGPELAEHLKKLHKAMMDGEPWTGAMGYLYKQQTLRLHELRKKYADLQNSSITN